MNWGTIIERWNGLRQRADSAQLRARNFRRRMAVLLAVLGPGLITSNVDNDAGGISVYSQSGAQYGYALLWALIPMTIALYVTEEMCARMAVATGKGLSDLIREEFGFRPTFFMMVAGFLVDLGNVVAEFAGVAAAMEIFGVSRYFAVPIAAVLVWILVVRGTYRQVEKIFLVACLFYLSYLFSAILAKPDWLRALLHLTPPHLLKLVPYIRPYVDAPRIDTSYLLTLTALVGTTIAPWQFFYMQAAFVEKRVGPRQYKQARADVMIGSISCMVIVFFIIVCTAATLYASGHRDIATAEDAARALIPLAGKWAGWTFAFGLLNASLFAASILPLSTAHVICEGLGFEAGIDRKFREAKIFYGLYTALIVIGAGVILIPNAPLWKILIFSQVGHGIWLPFVVIFILLLMNRRDLMGEHVNTLTMNVVAWVTAITMIVLTCVLLYMTIFHGGAAAAP